MLDSRYAYTVTPPPHGPWRGRLAYKQNRAEGRPDPATPLRRLAGR
jgi:hypothetical protein